MLLARQLVQRLLGEGPQGDGAEQAGLDAIGPQGLQSRQGNTGGSAVGGDDQLGVLALHFFPANLVFGDLCVLFRQVIVELVTFLRINEQGVDDVVMVTALPAAGRPVLGRQVPFGDGLPLDGLHHLADQTVSQDHHGVAVLVRDIKGLLDEVHSLLHVGGSQDHGAVVAVAAATGGLVVVTLSGLDGAQAGTAAHAVDDDSRDFRACQICNALLLQADAGRGGGGHGPHAGAGSAVNHVDGRNLGFGLDEHTARLGQVHGHVLGDFALGRDGITEEAVAAGADGSLGDGFVTLPQFLCHGE